MGRFFRRLNTSSSGPILETDLREEIETHRALRQAQLEDDGVTSQRARHASGRMIGHVAIAREDVHDLWIGSADAWWQDLRHGARTLAAKPGFTTASVLTLTLCLGVNLVVFTIVNALWLRPPAMPHPERVVMVTGMNDLSGTDEGFYFAEGGLERGLRSQPVFESVAGQVATSGIYSEYLPHIAIDRVGHEVETIGVTSQYFSVMGLQITGRDFTQDDDRLGAAPVVIISDRLWRTSFGHSPDALGTLVAASPVPVRVVGVAPADFHGARLGERADLWVPRWVLPQVSLAGRSAAASSSPPLLALARLKPGLSAADAKLAMASSRDPKVPAFASAGSVIPIGRIFGLPVGRTIVVEQQTVLWIAAATAGLVLLAGCATLMALVHYERRRPELAIRMALGCSRARLVRALVVELGGLAVAGALGAVAAAWAGLRALPALSLPGGLDLGRLDLGPDWRVATFGATASLIALAIAAHLPLRRSTRASLVMDLVSSSAKSTVSSLRLRRDIVVFHVAATVIVLVAAGLFVRTIVYGFTRGPGFDIDRTLFVEASVHSMMTSFPDAKGPARDAANAERVTRLLDTLRALPDVTDVSLGRSPIGLDEAAAAVTPRAFMTGSRLRTMPYSSVYVGPSYFDVLNITRIAGRGLTDADVANPAAADHPTSVIVTKSFAERLWPDGSALGQTFTLVGSTYSNEVVGVVSDFSLGSLRLQNSTGMFFATGSGLSARLSTTQLVLRARDPDRLVEPVRRTLAEIFPNAFHVDIATGREIIARDLGRERLGAWFFSGFGLVALALGVGGVFGLVAYLAESRRREMGIRLALGAMPGEIIRLIVTAGLWPVAVGTAAGLVGAALLARVLDSLLIGVGRLDPVTYVTAAVLMVGCTAAAGLGAAWQVRRISPNDALRVE